jgi:hypothetical protein
VMRLSKESRHGKTAIGKVRKIDKRKTAVKSMLYHFVKSKLSNRFPLVF